MLETQGVLYQHCQPRQSSLLSSRHQYCVASAGAAREADKVKCRAWSQDCCTASQQHYQQAGQALKHVLFLQVQVQQEELTRMAAEHGQKTAEHRLAEALSAAEQTGRDENAVQRRLADQAGSIMSLQHSLQSSQADLQKFHTAHARSCTDAWCNHPDAHVCSEGFCIDVGSCLTASLTSGLYEPRTTSARS